MKLKTTLLFFGIIICGTAFSQTKEIENYPYSFLVNNKKFRLREVKDADDISYYILEKFNSGWNLVDTLDRDDEPYGNIFFEDVNQDGFDDIVYPEKWLNASAFLYKPTTNTYINSGSFYLNDSDDDDFKSISIKKVNDSSKIYYDYVQGFLNDNYAWSSHMFTIKNYKRVDLGYITIDKNPLVDSAINVLIYRVPNNDLEKRILIKKIKWANDKEYNYASYWKDNWKNFLKQ